MNLFWPDKAHLALRFRLSRSKLVQQHLLRPVACNTLRMHSRLEQHFHFVEHIVLET